MIKAVRLNRAQPVEQGEDHQRGEPLRGRRLVEDRTVARLDPHGLAQDGAMERAWLLIAVVYAAAMLSNACVHWRRWAPRLAWLPISSLCVDHSYQRPVNARGLRTIAQICVAFEWCRFSPVIVAKAEDERYAIIDGQHRTIAALTLGYDEVPCSVIAADSKMQASIFASINGTVTPISKLALYKAGVRSGAEWALQVKRVCESAGIIALTYPKPYKALKPFETQSIGTLINRIGRHGEHVVAERPREILADDRQRAPRGRDPVGQMPEAR